MPDVIQTGQMVHRTSRPTRGPTLTQQRTALQRRPQVQAQWNARQQQAQQPTEMTSEMIAEAKKRSAREAQEQGLSKAQWLNKLYGTNFFMDKWGQGGRKSWGKDYYGGGGGGGGGVGG